MMFWQWFSPLERKEMKGEVSSDQPSMIQPALTTWFHKTVGLPSTQMSELQWLYSQAANICNVDQTRPTLYSRCDDLLIQSAAIDEHHPRFIRGSFWPNRPFKICPHLKTPTQLESSKLYIGLCRKRRDYRHGHFGFPLSALCPIDASTTLSFELTFMKLDQETSDWLLRTVQRGLFWKPWHREPPFALYPVQFSTVKCFKIHTKSYDF